jgi:MFS family permease
MNPRYRGNVTEVGVPAEPRAAVSGLRALKVLVIGLALRWFGISFYTPFILVYLHKGLGVSYDESGLLLASLGVATIPFLLMGGGLTDRFGRRRLIVLSFIGEMSGLIVLAASISLDSLAGVIGALLVSNPAASVGFPAVSAYVADSTDLTNRAKGFAWMRVGINAGFMGGVASGGILLLFLTYREVAALAATVLGFGVLVTALFLVPSPRDLELKRPAAARHRLTPQEEVWPRPSPPLAQTMASSIRVLWNDRTLLRLWIAGVLLWVLVYQYSYAVPTFARLNLEVSYGLIGAGLALNGLVPVVSQVPLTAALTGRRHTWTGAWGAGAYGLAFIVIGLDGVFRFATVPVFFAAIVVLTIGENMVSILGSNLPLNLAPERERGTYAGAWAATRGFGAIVAPLLAGAALSFTSQPLLTWTILAAPVVPAILLLERVGRLVPRTLNTV